MSELQLQGEKARGSSSINTFQSYDLIDLIKTWRDDSSSRNIDINSGICSGHVDREKDSITLYVTYITLYVNVHAGISSSEVNNKEPQKLSHNFWVQFKGLDILMGVNSQTAIRKITWWAFCKQNYPNSSTQCHQHTLISKICTLGRNTAALRQLGDFF